MPNVRLKNKEWIFVLLLVPGILFLFWKTKYGYGASDEPFYITVAHRLTKQDRLLVDEWNLSQLSGALLYPYLKLYLLLHPTTEGILLHIRLLYSVLQVVITIFLIIRLRKYGRIAYFLGYFYLLFTPYNIMSLSYNTMGIMLIVLSGILLATKVKSVRFQTVLAGCFFSLAVLCTPHLVILYAGLSMLAVFDFLYKKIKKREFIPLQLSFHWFYISIGCGIGALLLGMFMLSRAGIDEILKALPYILQDSDHAPVGLKQAIRTYLIQNWLYFREYIILQGCCILLMILQRKNNKWKFVTLQVSCVGCLLQLLYLATQIQDTYNFILYPLAWVGFLAFLLIEHKNWMLFFWGFLLGLGYTFSLNWASNQGMYAISMGMVLTDLCAIVFLWQVVQEQRSKSKRTYYAQIVFMALLLFLQLALLVYSKAVHVFWEPPVYELDTKIEEGPLKGIYTTSEHAGQYENIFSDLEYIKEKQPDNLLMIGFDTWGYLYVDMPYGTYSAWSGGESEHTLRRLAAYYTVNPDKTPEYLYVPKYSAWTVEEILTLLELNSKTIDELEQGYLIVIDSF